MPGREGLDLYSNNQNPTDLAGVISMLQQMRVDFDAHNHDGSSSRQLENIIAKTIQVNSAIIGGYKLFEAVVGPTAADYKTVAEALAAGKTRIFVRNGTYSNETRWIISNPNTIIEGESLGGVSITFAQDLANSRSIYVNGMRFSIRNLQLTSYEPGQQTLFVFGSGGVYPTVEDLIIRNKTGKCFEASAISNLFGLFSNIYFNFTATNDVTLMKAFSNVSNSVVFNSYFDLNGLTNSGCVVIDNCVNTQFIGCKLKTDQSSNQPAINSATTCFFSNCYFYVQEMVFDSVFNNCVFENNGNAPAAYFIQNTSINCRITNSTIKLTNASDNVLTSTSAGFMFCNNQIFQGKKIFIQNSLITIRGGMICNNQWVTSYDSAAADLEVASGTTKWNVIGNIIRNNAGGGTSTPTVTNGGTSNNVSSNQTILG